MKKLLTALLTLAMAFTMVFATAASAEDGYKDSITWVIGNDQDILDPQNNVSNSKVMPQYYNGLLGYDNDGNVVCKMAESYEASEDKMTWTFHLRQDVYFHSGRHCTAHDFEATFDRLLNTENPQRYTSNASSFIDTAVATDDYTFVITLKEPKAFFLQAIAKQWAFVLNPEYIEKYGADLGKTAESVDGTGPFKCTQWDKGEVMKFEAFENYYEGAPLTHEIVMKIVPEQTSRAIAVETAQADIADGVSPDDAVRLDALDGVTVSKTDGNGCHLFQFNCASDHAPMSIPAVRQAICYAIDRNAICEYLYSGLGEIPIDSIMAPSVAGYSSVGVVPYDPEKAKQLLAEAGYPDGFDLTIMTSAMYNRAVEMAEIIAEELKEIGINAKLEVVERAVFTSAWASFTPDEFNEKFGWDMFIMGSGGDSDADTLLKRIMHSADTNVNNYGFYNNAEVDELLEKGAVTMDETERNAIYARIAQITMYEDPFGAYMNLRKNVYALSDKKYDGMAYFTGHVYPKVDTLGEQVAGVLNRYDELFEKFGLKKENVIAANGFIKNMAHYGEIAEPFNAYFGENPPAGVIVEAPPRQNTPFGPKLEIELALFVATGENPQITRRDVVPGMSRVVEYNGIAWFTGHSARPEFKTLATQSEAVMKRYAELFEQFGYKKENILMEYGYVRDIEQVNDYLGARKVFIDPENPPAGVVVQAKPSGDENQLEVQFIVNLD